MFHSLLTHRKEQKAPRFHNASLETFHAPTCPGKANLLVEGKETRIHRNGTSYLACMTSVNHREKQLQLQAGAVCIHCAR